MARTSTGVSFVLKYPKKEISPIKAIFCFASLQMYYYEKKLSIPVKYWNKNSQRAKETKSFPGFNTLNDTLDKIETDILHCYRTYKNEFNSEPTIHRLRELVNTRRGKNVIKVIDPIDILQFGQIFIADAKEGKHINLVRGTQVTKVTIRTYEQTLRLLQSYAEYANKKLRFEEINTSFHKDFVHYLSNIYKYKNEDKELNLKVNTIGKHLTNIKTFMNCAIEKGFTKNDAFKNKTFKVIRENVENIALNNDEINALEKLDLNDNQRLDKVRDLFLIGCETGLRISDLKRLSEDHVIVISDKKYIKIEMTKTRNTVTIPITDRISRIIVKYKAVGQYFPETISDQKTNDYIKEIAKKIPLLCEEVIINSTEMGLRVSKKIPKYNLITNHTARRSFATNWALKGVPYQVIMRITGHKTERSFTRYIKINELEGAKLFEMEINKTKLLVV
ncbi:site-specific integrase [Ferruginibacter albus]|uniref:site-specific integrase n=1 Tax=Ferruginibacter albus TaxID=2875540 RepID=UPI001CC48F49|nr:site-specific integrase [Ferruginibacter albus]UAY52129.1 site-specific integrase [Ferruginibacter albus]